MSKLGWLVLTLLTATYSGEYDERHLIAVARAGVRAEVQRKQVTPVEGNTPVQPVFVTIEVKGVVRGCRGSLDTRTKSLEEEVQMSARAAAAHDPRYKPLTAEELKNFLVTVTIVSHKERIQTVDNLTASDGLVLQSGDKFGIVLPWEGKDPNVRLQWAYKKAGVKPGTQATLYRLIANRFRG